MKKVITALLLAGGLITLQPNTVKASPQRITIHTEVINGDTAKELEEETIRQEKLEAERKRKLEEEKKRKAEEEKKKRMENYQTNLYYLSQIIYGEAGGESSECQLAVGSVVLNRVKSKGFPNTIKGVIYQRGQYAAIGGRMWNKGADERAKKNAAYLLEHGSVLPSKVVYQTMFIPKWARVYKKIGTEYFSY